MRVNEPLNDMGHEKMMDKHGGTEAEAGSDHDQLGFSNARPS